MKKSEKKILRKLIRSKFDKLYDIFGATHNDFEKLIKIAKKLKLGKKFIQEMEKDLY